MVSVPINKDVLVWARKERGLSEKDAAKRLQLSETELADLENGRKQPSLTLLDRIAQKYRIPFASLMMPAPLPAVNRPADFRTYGGKDVIWDEHLLIGLEIVNTQIELLAELHENSPDLFKAPEIRNYSISRPAKGVAVEERNLFDANLDMQFSWPSGAQAFRHWRHMVERTGVFVQILNLGPENLCRGFSIFDERAIPVAVINGDDTDGPARTFTLFHEYAHILIRQPGISDQNRKNSVERWCNTFAAYFLMPEDSFKSDASAIDPSKIWSDSAIKKVADKYNVSMSAVALHLEEVGLAKPGLYEKKLEEWRLRKKSQGGQPMPYAERQVHRLGVRHVGLVLDAIDRKVINPIEAFELTDVDPKHFGDLRKEIQERVRNYGGVR